LSGFNCLLLFPKDGKIGSGTGKRRGEARFVPGTEKDIKENTQKEIVTKQILGKRIQLRDQFYYKMNNCS